MAGPPTAPGGIDDPGRNGTGYDVHGRWGRGDAGAYGGRFAAGRCRKRQRAPDGRRAAEVRRDGRSVRLRVVKTPILCVQASGCVDLGCPCVLRRSGRADRRDRRSDGCSCLDAGANSIGSVCCRVGPQRAGGDRMGIDAKTGANDSLSTRGVAGRGGTGRNVDRTDRSGDGE